jgi:hypothetical protein
VVCRHIERCSIKFEAGAFYIIPTLRRNTMAKRGFLALLVLTLAAGGAFAQVSAGVGGNFAVSFDSINYKYIGSTQEFLITTSGGGFYAFLDATYLEVNVGMLFGSQKIKISSEGYSLERDQGTVTYLTLGLFGKYPIDLGGFTLFPMLGIQFDLGLGAKDPNGNDLKFGQGNNPSMADYMNRFWVKFGVGADLNLSDAVYLRPSFLYGINFGTKDNNNFVKDVNDLPGYTATGFYHGLDIRVALGFRF